MDGCNDRFGPISRHIVTAPLDDDLFAVAGEVNVLSLQCLNPETVSLSFLLAAK